MIGIYGMNYDTDLVGGSLANPTPSGGGNIEDFEYWLDQGWALGYSRIGIGGDLPGYQADVHVNRRLADGWVFQLGSSMGHTDQFPGGPLRNDFSGVSYSLIKGFRLSEQWRFQASYTNLPVREYIEPIQRPVRSRAGYQLFTVSYSPLKRASRPNLSIDAGLLRLTDIRPVGFSYIYAGLSYRFRIPRLLHRAHHP